MTGNGGKSFCAGGDVKGVALAAKTEAGAGASAAAPRRAVPHRAIPPPPAAHPSPPGTGLRGTATGDFFREEYHMNHAVSVLGKPQVSLWDGAWWRARPSPSPRPPSPPAPYPQASSWAAAPASRCTGSSG